MELLSLFAVSVYCAVSLFMAVRLLLLWRRTHELPEIVIGLAFLSGGMIGYPGAVAGRVLFAHGHTGAGSAAHVVGLLGMAMAAFFLLLAWRQVFHPRRVASLAFVLVWSTGMALALALVILKTAPGAVNLLGSPFHWALMVFEAGCYATLAGSSFRYGRMLERRSAIGLGDPVNANRMILWSMSNLAIVVSYANALATGILLRLGAGNYYHPVVVTVLGMISALFVALAFFPPRAWVERIRARAATGDA
jgi:hypothetical protein